MKIPGIRRLWRTVRQLKKQFAPKGLILMYHSVAEVGSDPWSLCVTPQHFAEHLEVLQKYGCPIKLQELTQSLRHGDLPNRAVVITFDDGYANNLHNATPFLERYNIPATIFLVTGHIGCEREFWWDELDRILLQPGNLPETLNLNIKGNTYQWELGKAVYYREDDHLRHPDRRVWEGNPCSRRSLYHSLWQLLGPLTESERAKIVDELLKWARLERVIRPTHRSLSFEEMLTLVEEELIEIGSHTVTHPILSAHPVAFQKNEIQQSISYLENVLGRPVLSFSYPHGDYEAATLSLVREAGYACACTTVEETVWRNTDCFQLPRVQVQDWDGEEFAKRLSRWFHG